MKKWLKTCREFKNIREMINNDEPNCAEILRELIKICEKYGSQDWDFADDFMRLKEDIECIVDDDEDLEENVDYYLDEFYDLCDNARVWLDF